MASTIIRRTIGGVDQNNLAINLSQFGRMVTLPANWSRVRVALRLHMTNDGANITGTPVLYIGLGAGITNMIGDATTDHFVGVKYTATTWAYSATNYQLNALNDLVPLKKVGIVETTGTSLAGAQIYFKNTAAAGTANRTVAWADITRGSPNFSIRGIYNSNSAATEIASGTFYSVVGNVNAATLANHTFVGPQTVAVDESVDGTLNAIQVYWNKNDGNIESADIAVAVLA